MKARRNNKEMLRGEIQFMSNYLEGSRVKTSQVAESKKGGNDISSSVFTMVNMDYGITGNLQYIFLFLRTNSKAK